MKYFLTLVMICTTLNASTFGLAQTDSEIFEEVDHLEAILDQAENRATPSALRLLLTARKMVAENEIFIGSCWDTINTVFLRSGFPEKNTEVIFKSKIQGPFLNDQDELQPGDWVYYINHSFNDVEHSGLFVEWTDFNSREALIFSYAGGNRKTPARYKVYKLSSVYNIIRAK